MKTHTIVLLGLGGDGKTELVRSSPDWRFSRKYIPTDGIVKYTMEYPPSNDYCILDFPGQLFLSLGEYIEILRNADQIFLCIDMSRTRFSQSVTRLEKFLKDNDIEYTVIGTKADIMRDTNKESYYDFITCAKNKYSIFRGRIKSTETFYV